jgi:predicted PurR-regulated permease PerM
MVRSVNSREWQRAVILLAGVSVVAVAGFVLYWAQSIFIPLTMAAFLTFLLNPLVLSLRRHGLWRTPSVLIAVLVTALLLTSVGWMATTQISSLLGELPHYTRTMTEKIRSLKKVAVASGPLSKMVSDVYNEIVLPSAAAAREELSYDEARARHEEPRTVVVNSHGPTWLGRVTTFLNPLLEFMAQLALALVLLIFMLHKPEELRNRIIRLLGQGRIVATTRFVDETGGRISRFLLMQAIINCAVGIVVGVGLRLIGVKYALLWGFLTAIFRYLPYIGILLALAFPLVISFAMSPTLTPTLLTIGLYLAVELVVANFVEPRVYGQSMGVSEIALLVSAAFWASFWGPIGLVLSSPLTVCLVSLGRYVPQLEFLWIILGDGPPLEADVQFYQRLLARDEHEAKELVLEKLGSDNGVDTVYDGMLIRALRAAKLNHSQEVISDADLSFTLSSIKEIVDDLGDRASRVREQAESTARAVKSPSSLPIAIVGCPGHGEADRLALLMLRQLLDPNLWAMRVTEPRTLVAELIDQIAASKPPLVCIANVSPGGLARTRYLTKRLRASFPDLRLVVCKWGRKPAAQGASGGLENAGADAITGSLVATRDRLTSLVPVLAAKQQGTGPGQRESSSGRQASKNGACESTDTVSAPA